MKIEDFSLNINSEHIKSGSIKGVFEETLITLNTQNEEHFLKVLEYQMVQQFILILQQSSTTYNIHRDTQSFQLKQRNVTYEYFKHEKFELTMAGFIQTKTQKIDLNLNLTLSSTFMERTQLTKTQFYDPLIINFDGELPKLDTQTFEFDIDSNGEKDQISLLKQGSGFLAYDKNENGVIDNGNELFGAHNGNGFYDLKRFDEDNNGWIDENDPILDGLRVWVKNRGEERLVALGELGIGALYLGFAKTNYLLREENNEILGRISANGLYLRENGESGLLTQVDFARRDKKNENSPLAEVLQSS